MAGPILTAELLSIGSELTVGDTRDTNAGDLARSLTEQGVRVVRIQALPDDLDVVAGAFDEAAARADLVVSTGGLGPTPDDLTREALARVCGETPAVDRDLERWLRGLWARRGLPFPELNLKQAWLIPAATAIPNENGTAPGWWLERTGAVIVALPGPPREMRPMWDAWALPRLRARGLGLGVASVTLRLHGIGESQAAARLGEELLRAPNPSVATYARQDAVDVRISAVPREGQSAAELVASAEATVLERLGEYVWARGTTTWAEAIAEALHARGWTLATVEAETGGSLAALLSTVTALRRAVVLAQPGDAALEDEAAAARAEAGVDVGLALRVTGRGEDTAASIVLITPNGVRHERRVVFLGGTTGRHRAALATADILLSHLRSPEAHG